MSGPIVRKYGFPNFEKIFGERELKHGAEDEPARPAAEGPAAGQPTPAPVAAPDDQARPGKPGSPG